MFQKRIYSIFRGTLVGKRKQTIFKKRWFDITSCHGVNEELGEECTAITYYIDDDKVCDGEGNKSWGDIDQSRDCESCTVQ